MAAPSRGHADLLEGNIQQAVQHLRRPLPERQHDEVPVTAYTKSPPGRRAAALEQVLLHGQHGTNEDSRRMSYLGAVARRYVDGLGAWVDSQTAQIEDAMAQMDEGTR